MGPNSQITTLQFRWGITKLYICGVTVNLFFCIKEVRKIKQHQEQSGLQSRKSFSSAEKPWIRKLREFLQPVTPRF